MKVLGEVKLQFPEVKLQLTETKQLMEKSMEQECLKEKITVEKVICFYNFRSKELAQKKHFLFCSEYAKRYCIKPACFVKQFCKNDGMLHI